jgi:hypothetical protein
MPMFEHRRFRSNPEFEAVADGTSGGRVGAVLRSRATGAYVAAVDHEAAALFCKLARPQCLAVPVEPKSLRVRDESVARLLFDQILQIEQASGTFVDGVRAYDDLFANGRGTSSESTRCRLDGLSRRAIDQAVALPALSAIALAWRLYAFNATPRTRCWDEVLAGSSTLARWLGLDRRQAWMRRLARRYSEHGSRLGDTPWYQWIRGDIKPQASLRHKIYVCPTSLGLPDALPRVAEACLALDVPAFKVGVTIHGVLRPDKLLVYVEDEQALFLAMAELGSAITGFDAQPVPFSAPFGEDGLLSWAVDPSPRALAEHPESPASWRTAVAASLAGSIARAQGLGSAEIAAEFALQRLRLDGIEPVGWLRAEGW